jgi:hypothetical protein
VSSKGLQAPGDVRWRVGHVSDPIGFLPWEQCSWNHRFDDPEQRFRTLYCAIESETALREVLADLRRDTREVANYLATFGADAIADLSAAEITADWRRQNVLVCCRINAQAEILDLTDPTVRHAMEQRHAALLAAHGMKHLDITEVTRRRRSMTRVIAADAYDELGCAGIRFPSRLDGLPCFALFEGRASLEAVNDPIYLTDPAPQQLVEVAGAWGLTLAAAPALSERRGTS